MFWDNEEHPSVEAPLGDFFGMGHGLTQNFTSPAFAMSPQDGRDFSCYFPMPFREGARFELENQSDASLHFYFYVDYEQVPSLPAETGYFHAQFHNERNTKGWAAVQPSLIQKERGGNPEFPSWFPDAWVWMNTSGEDNYVMSSLRQQGRASTSAATSTSTCSTCRPTTGTAKADDMIFINGEKWPPNLHGMDTEDLAYWYQTEPHAAFLPLGKPEDRIRA